MATKDIPEETRKAIFRDVVDAEDHGEVQREARRKVAVKYAITVDDVRKIESEGIDKTWPPLDECED